MQKEALDRVGAAVRRRGSPDFGGTDEEALRALLKSRACPYAGPVGELNVAPYKQGQVPLPDSERALLVRFETEMLRDRRDVLELLPCWDAALATRRGAYIEVQMLAGRWGVVRSR